MDHERCGFGKGGLKNYQGIVTGLMMQTYLVIVDFKRRVSKKGESYGMPVSIMLPPETVWGYDLVTSAYSEKPSESWQRIYDHVKDMYEEAEESYMIVNIYEDLEGNAEILSVENVDPDKYSDLINQAE